MYVCIAYDISSNRTRVRVGKACKKAGLLRMQKSMFIGKIQAVDLKILVDTVRPTLGIKDKWSVIRMNKREFSINVEQSGEKRLQALAKQAQYWDF